MLFNALPLFLGIIFLCIFCGCVYFRLTLRQFAIQMIRVTATHIFAHLYQQDQRDAERLCRQFRRGLAVSREDAFETFAKLPQAEAARIEVIFPHASSGSEIPFVYESPDAPHLEALRERYHLREMIRNARDEYDAMLRLGAWVGTRWDHGTDVVPDRNATTDPAAVIQAGEQGAKFWCEIAAKTLVLAATSLGWAARLTTTSRDGYTWEHAVAELWSNQFRKWFVIDPDFNVVYEENGVPLSAFELCHRGLELARANRLSTHLIAPTKLSLPFTDLLAFYAYAHIEMRTDWQTRHLRRGSPAGGDLQTWRTARPGFKPLLTARIRQDEPMRFDWPVNTAVVSGCHIEQRGERTIIHFALIGYCPYFKTFQFRLDDGEWQESVSGLFQFDLTPGDYALAARIVTLSGELGPIYEGQIRLKEHGVRPVEQV
ncbi:hypothetical protein U14_02659 [Candidatus Moduliflexus flocculans]|uniref:Transglutaminase-like domain-containing protein n=1 Tax=Candidatus Moduliflexus flocculans TaxID=1499966 RepID=A0A081BLZ9_9BACT|nr:hypothetical protein U14_02659 [Candidatus Moduliflexus flocculans]